MNVGAGVGGDIGGGKRGNGSRNNDDRYNDYARKLRPVSGLPSEHVVRDLLPLRELPHRDDPRRGPSERLALDLERSRGDRPLLCLGTEGPSPAWRLRRVVVAPARSAPLSRARGVPNARDPRRARALRRAGYDEWSIGPPSLVENPQVPAEEETNPVLVCDSSDWPASRHCWIELEPHECNVQRSQLAALGLCSDIEEDMRSVDSDSEPGRPSSRSSGAEDEAARLYRQATPVPEDRPMLGLELDSEMEVRCAEPPPPGPRPQRQRTISEDGIVRLRDVKPEPLKRPLPREDEAGVETVDLDELDDHKRIKLEAKLETKKQMDSSVETVDLSDEDDVETKAPKLELKPKPPADDFDPDVIEIDDDVAPPPPPTSVGARERAKSAEIVIDLLDDSDDDDGGGATADKNPSTQQVEAALAESIEAHEKRRREIERENEELAAAVAESIECRRVELEKQYEEFEQVIGGDLGNQQQSKDRHPEFETHYGKFTQGISEVLQAPGQQPHNLEDRLEKIYEEFTLAISRDSEAQKQQVDDVVVGGSDPSSRRVDERRRESVQSANSSLEASLLREDDDEPPGSPALSSGTLEDLLLSDCEDGPVALSTSAKSDDKLDEITDAKPGIEHPDEQSVNSISAESERPEVAENVNIESSTAGETNVVARLASSLKANSTDNQIEVAIDVESKVSDFHREESIESLENPSVAPAPVSQVEGSDPIVKSGSANDLREEIAAVAAARQDNEEQSHAADEPLRLPVVKVSEAVGSSGPNSDPREDTESSLRIDERDDIANVVSNKPATTRGSGDSTAQSIKIVPSRTSRTSTESNEDFYLRLDEEEEGLQSEPEQTATCVAARASETESAEPAAVADVASAEEIDPERRKTTDLCVSSPSSKGPCTGAETDGEVAPGPAVDMEQSSVIASEMPENSTNSVDEDEHRMQMEAECDFKLSFSEDEDEKCADSSLKVSPTSSEAALDEAGEGTTSSLINSEVARQLQESVERTLITFEQDEAAVASSVLAELLSNFENSNQNCVLLNCDSDEIDATSDEVHCSHKTRGSESLENVYQEDEMDTLKFKDSLKMSDFKVEQSEKVPAAALDHDDQDSSAIYSKGATCKFYQKDSDAPLSSGKVLAYSAKSQESSSALNALCAKNADCCVAKTECNSRRIKVYKKSAGNKSEILAVCDHQYARKLPKLDTDEGVDTKKTADKTEKSSASVGPVNDKLDNCAVFSSLDSETCIPDGLETIDTSSVASPTVTPVEPSAESLQVRPVACSNVVVARLEIEKETSVEGIFTSRTSIEFVSAGMKRKADESFFNLVASPKKIKSIRLRPLTDATKRPVQGARKLAKQTLLFELPSAFSKWCLLNAPRLFVGYNECLQRSEAFWGARYQHWSRREDEIPMICSLEEEAHDVETTHCAKTSDSGISTHTVNKAKVPEALLEEQSQTKSNICEDMKIFQRRHSLPVIPLSVQQNICKRSRSSSTDIPLHTKVPSNETILKTNQCVNKIQTIKQKTALERSEKMDTLPSVGYVEPVPELEDVQSHELPLQNFKPPMKITCNFLKVKEKKRVPEPGSSFDMEQRDHAPLKRQKLFHNSNDASQLFYNNYHQTQRPQPKIIKCYEVSPKINIHIDPFRSIDENDSDDDDAEMGLTIDTAEYQESPQLTGNSSESPLSSHSVSQTQASSKPSVGDEVISESVITTNESTVYNDCCFGSSLEYPKNDKDVSPTLTHSISEELDINENSKKDLNSFKINSSSSNEISKQSDLEDLKIPRQKVLFNKISEKNSNSASVSSAPSNEICKQLDLDDIKIPSCAIKKLNFDIAKSKLQKISNAGKKKKKMNRETKLALFGADSDSDDSNHVSGKKDSSKKTPPSQNSGGDGKLDKDKCLLSSTGIQKDGLSNLKIENCGHHEAGKNVIAGLGNNSQQDSRGSLINENEESVSIYVDETSDREQPHTEQVIDLVEGDWDYLGHVSESPGGHDDYDSGYNNDEEESKEPEENLVHKEEVNKSEQIDHSKNCMTQEEDEIVVLEESCNNTSSLRTVKIKKDTVVESPKIPDVIEISDSEEDDAEPSASCIVASRCEMKLEKESDSAVEADSNRASQAIDSSESAQSEELPEIPESSQSSEESEPTQPEVLKPAESGKTAVAEPNAASVSARTSDSFNDQILMDIIATCCSNTNQVLSNDTSTLTSDIVHPATVVKSSEGSRPLSRQANNAEKTISPSKATSSHEHAQKSRSNSDADCQRVKTPLKIVSKDPYDPSIQKEFNLVKEDVAPESVRDDVCEDHQETPEQSSDDLLKIYEELQDESSHLANLHIEDDHTSRVQSSSAVNQLKKEMDKWNLHFVDVEVNPQPAPESGCVRVCSFASETFSNVSNSVGASTSSSHSATTSQQSPNDGQSAAVVGAMVQPQPGPSSIPSCNASNPSNIIPYQPLPLNPVLYEYKMRSNGLLHQMQAALLAMPNPCSSNTSQPLVYASQMNLDFGEIFVITDCSLFHLPLSNISPNTEEFRTVVNYRSALLNELLQCIFDFLKLHNSHQIGEKLANYGTLDRLSLTLQLLVITIAQCVHSLTLLTNEKDRTAMIQSIDETLSPRFAAVGLEPPTLHNIIRFHDGLVDLGVISRTAHQLPPPIRGNLKIQVPDGLPEYPRLMDSNTLKQKVQEQIVCLLQSCQRYSRPIENDDQNRSNSMQGPTSQARSPVNSNNTTRVLSSSPGQASTSPCPDQSPNNTAKVVIKKEIDTANNGAPHGKVCRNCGKRSQVKCNNCKRAAYCSKYCQEKHWVKRHHKKCDAERDAHSSSSR